VTFLNSRRPFGDAICKASPDGPSGGVSIISLSWRYAVRAEVMRASSCEICCSGATARPARIEQAISPPIVRV
jgi:hypothetical protein